MNPPRLIYVALLLYALGFALLFGSWMVISYLPPKENGPALALWITATLGALVGHILTILTGDWSGKSAPPAAPPVPAGQGGFHTLRFALLLVFCALVAAALSACASLTDAGHAAYTFEPVVGADGKATGGCKFSATDGKEFSGRSIAATSTADGCQVMVQEGASTAFQGQAIAGKALSVLPSFAPMLLPQGPASLALPQAAQPAAATAPAASGPKP